MKTKNRCILLLLAPLALGTGPAMAQAQRGKQAELSLGEAVSRAQHETQGQVLSAESRRFERRTEYRIKVLTPQGHVQVMTIPATGGENFRPAPIPSTHNPPGRRAGVKEKH